MVTLEIANKDQCLKFLHGIIDQCGDFYGSSMKHHRTKPEYVYEFVRASQPGTAHDFLEVGSFLGVSMVLIASLLKESGRLGRLTSVDPYPESDFEVAAPGMLKRSWPDTVKTKTGKKKIIDAAKGLYESFDLDVTVIREDSSNALPEMLMNDMQYDMIFIDGDHQRLKPMLDSSLSLLLLRDENSLLALDDVQWPEISPVFQILKRSIRHITTKSNTAVFRNVSNSDGQYFYQQGSDLIELGKFEHAVAAAENALQSGHDNKSANILLAHALIESGEFARAQTQLDELLESYGAISEVQFLVGLQALKLGYEHKADKCFRSILDDENCRPLDLDRSARACLEFGATELAKALASAAVMRRGNVLATQMLYVDCLLEDEDVATARKYIADLEKKFSGRKAISKKIDRLDAMEKKRKP